MTIKNNKNTKTIIVTSIISTIIIAVIYSTSSVSAINTPPVDNTNYFAQARVVFAEIQGLETQVNADNEKISSLKSQLAKAQTGTVENANLEREVQDLQALIDAKGKRITDLYGELDRLEQLNVEAFKVDDATRQKLQAAEKVIDDQYVDENSANYVGDNPVELAFAHTKNRNIVIILDPQEITEKKINIDSLKIKIANTIKSVIGEDIPIDIQFGQFHSLACTARDSTCRPLLGGVSVAKKNINSLNTLGYKASKTGEGTGFVIAGHTAQNLNAVIIQPHTDTQNK